jgi:hypothetical protein
MRLTQGNSAEWLSIVALFTVSDQFAEPEHPRDQNRLIIAAIRAGVYWNLVPDEAVDTGGDWNSVVENVD